MRRKLKYAGSALLGLVAVLSIVLLGLLGSSTGSHWLLSWVPGLQVEGFTGRLGGHWQARQLLWQQGESQLRIEEAELHWSPGCLLRLRLCINRLAGKTVALNLASADTASSDQPVSLPQLYLPMSLALDEAQIGTLWVNGNEQLQGLELVAKWTGDGLQVKRLQLQRSGLALDLSGQLQARGDWPLRLQGTAKLPAPEHAAWQLKLAIEGELQRSLSLQADSSGYLLGRLTGTLQPLAEQLPASLEFHAESFKAATSLPDTLSLQAVQLTASGNLQQGYAVQGQASLPAEGSAIALSLTGRVDAQGAKLSKLLLSAGEEQYLSLNAELDWQQAFSIDSHVVWQDFPWQRLYPVAEPVPVLLQHLNADLAYSAGNYLGNLQAKLQGPAGAFSVQTPFSGDLQQLHLPQLQVEAGQGRIDGQLSLAFAQALGWNARLQLSDFDPSFWLAELPGRIAGPLRAEGQFTNGLLELNSDLDLQGHLRGQPARLKAQLSGAGQHWLLPRLALRLGDNRIQGQGQLEQRGQASLDIALARLEQLWPGLRGQLQGQLNLAGKLQAPEGRLLVKGHALAFNAQRLRSLSLEASLDARQQGRLQLQAQGIASGETELGELRIEGQGSSHQQQLQFDLQGDDLSGQLALDGSLDKGNWRGRLSRGEIQLASYNWRLQQPAALVRLLSGELDLGAHCWRSGAASLCADQQRLQPQAQMRYRLTSFPLDSLQPWLPEDFSWQGQLNAEVQLNLPDTGPDGKIVVDAGKGLWRVRNQGQWVDFNYDNLRLVSELKPRRIDSQLQLDGEKIGKLLAQLRIDPVSAKKKLSGQFRLSGVDLALARPFMPMVEQMAGRLNGSGTFAGELLDPRIDGQLQLTGGQLSGSELPMDFEDLQLNALIAGAGLQLKGSWRSGEQGRGELNGALDWQQGLAGNLKLRGSHLPVTVEPYAHLQVAPDLLLRLANEQVSLSGKLDIPQGRILVRELPPSTVKLSEDAQIQGEAAETKQAMPISMDVDVEVGRERLSFKGFGLDALLVGHLHIGDDLNTRGQLELNKGRFRGYGQKLNIRRARLFFSGPIDQPLVDIEAIRRVDDVVAGLRLTGRAEQPHSEVFSEPTMSDEQALSYLVLGRPLASGDEDSSVLAQAALALGVAGGSSVVGSLAEKLGIDDFQLDTEGSGSSTSVVASGNLSERLSLRYGVGVFEPVSSVALRYELSRRLYLEAASGLASSLDLFYKRDF